MEILRVTARWTGFLGAPGFSSFHFSSGFLDGGLLGDEAQLVADRVSDAFNDLQVRLPDTVTVQVEPTVEVLDSDTGMILDFTDITPKRTTTGSASGGFAGPVGAVINWRTRDLRGGRRIRGRTFIVPLANAAFESDGTLTSVARGDVQDFANDLRGGGLDADLGVWSRPVNGSGGVFATVTGSDVPDMAAVLRSRRD